MELSNPLDELIHEKNNHIFYYDVNKIVYDDELFIEGNYLNEETFEYHKEQLEEKIKEEI